MKKITLLFLILLVSSHVATAQKSDLTRLFSDQQTLDIKLKVSIKDIKKKTNDSTYLPYMFYVKNSKGGWDSIKIDVRARGIFRRKNCYFAPLKIKTEKENTKGTVLEGNKSLKLVLPCQNNNGNNVLLMKEYVAYKMYERISPYYFNTRLVNLEFNELDGKKNKTFQLSAFFIEDDDKVAKRNNAKVMEKINLHPLGLNDTAALRHDFFQYMIANTDWSTTFLHNAKVMFKEPKTYIPLAYDFDISGFVNPPYAEVNADLGISSVRDRLYRGFCRKEPVVQYVRKEFVRLEPEIMGTMERYRTSFPEKEYADMRSFIGEFFTIFKDDSKFNKNIVEACRKK